ncbi:MAG: DUF4149 domain-containing protein [Ectothiorhodospiraceae bacterium]|nr:DUF4149 domain-containing protein [Ectothiorhodospiraceae bacterium]MCH8503118.1 DUF4149 domain-containing protein [Ectothiorhodospiraceae bacterium]
MTSLAERLLITIWVGGLWAIGYVAAPAVFSVLEDRQLAGLAAGEMFTAMAWIGAGCGILLLLIYLIQRGGGVFRQWRFWVVGVMLLLTLLGEFALRSQMEAARGTEAFGQLHGLAQIVFLGVAVLGLSLAVAGPAGPAARKDIFR